jgi:hypothetical protein
MALEAATRELDTSNDWWNKEKQIVDASNDWWEEHLGVSVSLH